MQSTTEMATAFGVRLLGILLANSAKLFLAPEGRRKLAGGGAKRNHRDESKKIVRVPAGTPDLLSQQDQSRSGALSGRVVLSCRYRWLRFARHRLISLYRPDTWWTGVRRHGGHF